MTYQVVIPAAGVGQRMGVNQNKLFLPLKGIPIIVHTLFVFQRDPACEAVILAINPQEQSQFQAFVSEYGLTKVKKMVRGGSTRQESVYQGLSVIEHYDSGIVLIHDGARPFLHEKQIEEVVMAAERYDAAVLAVPVKDTIKTVQNFKVSETLNRSHLWATQTPQAFVLSRILEAHEQSRLNGREATDDASLIEAVGGSVYIVQGDYKNIKITTPDDLIIGEAILSFLKERES